MDNPNEQEFKTIKRAALHLLETEGFMDRYEEICLIHDISFEQAYEMTEQEHLEAFEKRRYRNAHNFRKSYNQYRKRKILNK